MHSHLNPLLLISAALKTSLMNSSTELDTHPLSNKTVEAFYYSPFHLFLSAHPSHVLPSVSFCNQSLSSPPHPERSSPRAGSMRRHAVQRFLITMISAHLPTFRLGGLEIDVCVVAGKKCSQRTAIPAAPRFEKAKTFHQRWFTLTPFHLARLRSNWTVSSWRDGGCISFFQRAVLQRDTLDRTSDKYYKLLYVWSFSREKNTVWFHNRQKRTKHSRDAGKMTK